MEPRLHIIGLCGFAGAGKDTAADVLVRHCRFRKIAFADALKAEIVTGFCVDPDLFRVPAYKAAPTPALALERCHLPAFANAVIRHEADRPDFAGVLPAMARERTPREIMQLWGTEFRRHQDENYWTKQLLASIRYFIEKNHPQAGFVIPDCRFANEVDTIRRMGGRLWQVKRPDQAAGSSHASATDGTEFRPDLVLHNSHTPKHLQQLVLGEFWAIDAGLEGLRVQLP